MQITLDVGQIRPVAASDEKAAAYAAYRVALDREAQAAWTLELRLAAA